MVKHCKRGILKTKGIESVKSKLSKAIHLLPIYDEYITGYKKREAILQVYHSIKPKPASGHDNTIVSDGQIIGTWRRVIKPKHIDLHYQSFQRFTSLQQAEFQKAIDLYQKFTGLEVIVRYAPVAQDRIIKS